MMKTILCIKSSANGDNSVSNRVVDSVIGRLLAGRSDLTLILRDLDEAPIPHVSSKTLAGIGRAAPNTRDTTAAQLLSDELIGELKAAEAVLIGAPMYNFGIPTTLKSWFDYVIRAGQTFQYTAQGPQGLVDDKPVVVVESRGGVYSEGPAKVFDFQEPHLRALLGLMGLKQVKFLRVEGLALGDAETKITEALDGFGELNILAAKR